MRNHIVSIVAFLSLIIGLCIYSVRDLHESSVNIEDAISNVSNQTTDQKVENAASFLQSSCSFSSSTVAWSGQQSQSLFIDSTDYYRAFNCILTNDAYQVNTTSVKNLKLGFICINEIIGAHFQKDTYYKSINNSNLFSLNATRYLSKYYVYALEHILI